MTEQLSISERGDGWLEVGLPARCDLRVAHQLYDSLKTKGRSPIEIRFPPEITFFSGAMGEILLRLAAMMQGGDHPLHARGGQVVQAALGGLGMTASSIFSQIDAPCAEAGAQAQQSPQEAA